MSLIQEKCAVLNGELLALSASSFIRVHIEIDCVTTAKNEAFLYVKLNGIINLK